MPRILRSFLLAALGLTLAVAAAWPVAANGRLTVPPVTSLTLSAPAGPTAWLVELEEPGAAVAWAEVVEQADPAQALTHGVFARARAAAESRLLSIAAAQDAVAPALERLGAREIYRVRRALNGIAVLADARQAAAMRGLPGVRRVRAIEPEVPHNRTSVPFIGAPQVWTSTPEVPAGLRGRGLRIGIIDTGIDYVHGTFGGSGTLADYQQGAADSSDWIANPRSGPGRFPTAKVAGGWDFAGDLYSAGNPAQATPQPDPNPMDCNGHGSHVAGTAAGYGVTAAGTTYTGAYNTTDPYSTPPRIGPGVAPEASLYALRVFGCGGSTVLTAQAIDWAIDPNGDGDFSDRLDVINMSLGSNYGNPSDVSADASDAAARAGVVVVASAGNAGDTYFVTGSPGAASRAISVANVADDGVGAYVQVGAPPALAGRYAAGTAAFGPPVADAPVGGELVLVDDGVAATSVTDGCEAPFVNAAAVAGRIALIDRGTCSFKTKTLNAQTAGAIGVVIANNASGDPPGMADDPTIVTPITIPTLSVSLATGDSLKAALAGETVTLSLLPGGDGISSSSSRGPRNGVPIRLKPDVAAPGSSIPSAQAGRVCTGTAPSTGCIVSNPTGYIPDNAVLTISGTSMAAPHVAGLMALLREARPGWTVEQLKALLMNYSVHDVFKFAGEVSPQIGAGRVGAGRVDAARSAEGPLIALNADEPGLVSVSFDGEVSGTVTSARRVRVENHGLVAYHVALGLQANVTAPGVSFSLSTTSLNVPAGGFANFDVVMTADATQMALAPDPSVAAVQGTLARHRLAEAAAYVTFAPGNNHLTLQNGGPQMRLPVYAALKPVSSTTAAGPLLTGGAATGTGSIALEGTGVCTGSLSGPYCSGSFPADRASLVSAFELQGISPKAPDLYGSGFEAGDLKAAGVQYDSANGVLVFGIATWDTWATPAQVVFNVIVDGNADGTEDRLLFNPRFTSGGLPTDWHLGGTAAYPTGSGAASNYYVNLVGPSTVDTGLFGSSVLAIAATPASLGATAGQAFRWRVVSCPGFDPFCGLPGGFPLDSMGPFTWSSAAQGLDFSGSWLLDDQDGTEIPVSWNVGNIETNGSVGALLLHHLGAEGRRAEVVLVQTSATTPPSTVDLAVTVGVSMPLAPLQSEVAIAATASNAGPEDAAGVAVHVPIPAGLTHVSHSGSGTYDPATGVWTVGALPAGGTAASLQVVVAAAVPGLYRLLVEVSTSTPLDVAEGNNRATATLTVPPQGYTVPGGYYTVRPCRVIDTRNATGTWGGPALAAQVERVFPVAGQCGVSPTAKAIAVNVTAAGATGSGFLRLYAAFPASPPNTSVLNFNTGVTRANNAVVQLNAAGQIAVFNGMPSGTTDFVLDVVGYFE